ncbi:MAG: DUF4089 domain-containing protein [Cyanobacteriota bacterium]|nr:DUF4089 domain-containing protein [Cyanobacteriota bacterium]
MNDKNQEKIGQAVENIAKVIDLKIDSEYRSGVEDNFAKLTQIAQLVMEFPLDSSIEAAPKFEP